MSGQRKKGQRADAFSLPESLYNAAIIAADKIGCSRSGFYRYCLAKELGYSEADALRLQRHAGELNAVDKVRAAAQSVVYRITPAQARMNDAQKSDKKKSQ